MKNLKKNKLNFKSGNSDKYLPDSIKEYLGNKTSWTPDMSVKFNYDSIGNSTVYYYYDAQNNYKSKEMFQYNNKGNVILMETFNYINDSWTETKKTISSFNENGDQILYVELFKNTTWDTVTKITLDYVYDANKNKTFIQNTVAQYDSTDQIFEYKSRYTQQIINGVWTERGETMVGGSWSKNYMYENVVWYNIENNQKSSYKGCEMALYNDTWTEDNFDLIYNYTATYNSYGVVNEHIKLASYQQQSWVTDYLDATNTYDSNGNQTEYKQLLQLDNQATVQIDIKIDYTYDNNKNIMQAVRTDLDTATGIWHNTLKDVYFSYSYIPSACAFDLGSDITVSKGNSVTLTADTKWNINYLWSTGETTKSITVSPTASTSYSVTVSASNCTSSQSINILVSDCFVNISKSTNGNVTTLTAVGKSGSMYSWSTGQVTTSPITVMPTTTTTYSVTMTNGSCTAYAQTIVDVTTGIYDLEGNIGLKINNIYPNPATDKINLDLYVSKSSKLNIEVYDIIGNKVLSFDKGVISSGENALTLDLSSLSGGTYILKVLSDDKELHSKFNIRK
ncbi:MAG: T9SS type A sorting domain-containing protein [Bacteroidota bacterium]|nr:T9SS type A sorting domain-containing protein [Bacteroidota bacterium]